MLRGASQRWVALGDDSIGRERRRRRRLCFRFYSVRILDRWFILSPFLLSVCRWGTPPPPPLSAVGVGAAFRCPFSDSSSSSSTARKRSKDSAIFSFRFFLLPLLLLVLLLLLLLLLLFLTSTACVLFGCSRGFAFFGSHPRLLHFFFVFLRGCSRGFCSAALVEFTRCNGTPDRRHSWGLWKKKGNAFKSLGKKLVFFKDDPSRKNCCRILN